MAEAAIVFLVRGADSSWRIGVERFAASFEAAAAGSPCRLYVVVKGFASMQAKQEAVRRFSNLGPTVLETSDDELDIGAYRQAVGHIQEDLVCFLNTHAEILASGWLNKMIVALQRPGMGMVGATGSFESLSHLDGRFPVFPNVHVRTNGFLIRRVDAIAMLAARPITGKLDAFMIESGPESLTRQFVRRGFEVAVVARSGRPYLPPLWPSSGTFRQFDQSGLLVGDNQTRTYEEAPWKTKRELVRITWGGYIQMGRRLPWRQGKP